MGSEELDYRLGLAAINFEPLVNHLRMIIHPINQLRAADVADAILFRWPINKIVDVFAFGACSPSSKSPENLCLIDVKKNERADDDSRSGSKPIQRHGLVKGSGITIQQKALSILELRQLVKHHARHKLVRYELPAINKILYLFSKGRLVRNCVPEYVSGGEMLKMVIVREMLGLGAFSGAGRSKEDNVHPSALSRVPASASPALNSPGLRKSLVMAHDQVRFQLRHGIECHSHHNEN